MKDKKYSEACWKTKSGCSAQSRAAEQYYDQIFEEMKGLEEKKSEEALLLVQKASIHGDFRTKEKKQEVCRDLEAREG